MKPLHVIAYYYTENIVATQRVSFLTNVLSDNKFALNVITKFDFGCFVASSKFLWFLFVFFKLLFLKKNSDIFVTSGPFWHLPAVLIASKIRRHDVIYDFRDPWSFDIEQGYGGTHNKGSLIKVKIARLLERYYYKSCKYFFVCSDGSYESYKMLFGGNKKLKLVLNGYEYKRANVICNDKPLLKKSSIKIVCLGRLLIHGASKIDDVFLNLKKHIENNNNKIQLLFVGSEKEELQKLLYKYDLLPYSLFFNQMSHADAINIASCCDIGLCTIRDENLIHGTKIFDYIGLGLPVLDVFNHDQRLYKYFKKHLLNIDDIGDAVKYEPPENLSRKHIFNEALKYFK